MNFFNCHKNYLKEINFQDTESVHPYTPLKILLKIIKTQPWKLTRVKKGNKFLVLSNI